MSSIWSQHFASKCSYRLLRSRKWLMRCTRCTRSSLRALEVTPWAKDAAYGLRVVLWRLKQCDCEGWCPEIETPQGWFQDSFRCRLKCSKITALSGTAWFWTWGWQLANVEETRAGRSWVKDVFLNVSCCRPNVYEKEWSCWRLDDSGRIDSQIQTIS